VENAMMLPLTEGKSQLPTAPVFVKVPVKIL